MSKWCCAHCGLLNKKDKTTCIACFRCSTLNINQDKEWIATSIDYKFRIDCKYKMIKWNKKLYLIEIDNNHHIAMIQYKENRFTESHPSQKLEIYNDSGYGPCCFKLISYTIDAIKNKLYLMTVCRKNYNVGILDKILLTLIIYDLNKQKTLNTLNITFPMEWRLRYYDIYNINMIIPNNKTININKKISYNIIKYWKRKNYILISSEIINLPIDVFNIIDSFYSLYNDNLIHIIIIRNIPYSDDEHDYNLWQYHHGLININNANDDDLKMEIMDKEAIEIKKALRYKDDFRFIISFCNDLYLLLLFNEFTLKIDLQRENIMNKIKKSININKIIINYHVFDALQGNMRYIYVMSKEMDILYVDKWELAAKTIEFKDEGIPKLRNFDDFICFDGYLYIATTWSSYHYFVFCKKKI